MMLRITPATVTNKPVTGESTKETVKTIARGMPGVFRCDRGDYRVLTTFCTRAAGASGARHSQRPCLRGACVPLGIACALCLKMARFSRKTRAVTCGEIAKLCLLFEM